MLGILTRTTTTTTIISKQSIIQTQIRHATKKAGGSSNNGRDSAGRRLGIKVWPGTIAKPGSIVVRQRGNKFVAGDNVGRGKDHTLFSKVEGVVRFGRNERGRNVVNVYAAA